MLASIFEGAPFDDMKELLSISKQNYDNTQNETICIDSSDTNTSCSNDSDIAFPVACLQQYKLICLV